MSTRTVRNPRHPWTYFKAMEEKMKKLLTSKSNENLDKLLKQAGREPVELRKDKIRVLMEQWEHNYRAEFERLHGFPLDDTLDAKKFRKHFRTFKRQTKRQIFFHQLRLLASTIVSTLKRPFMKKEITHPELLQILQDVDNSDKEVTDWEARFIESNLNSRSFTRRQKEIILDLQKRYLA
jgi:hypothetical protein